jgi:hypothetical protein
VLAQASITGVVKDTSGAILPGVTVEAASPALIEKTRSVVTDDGGQYRIENLRPGTYSVTFTLGGFSSVKREGIELTGAFTASVNADMRVGALEETITVTGETPVVDVQSSNRERVLTQDVINSVPANRYPSFMAALIPGVTGSVVDVGGNTGSPVVGGGSLSVHGSRTTDVEMQRNGVSVSTIETGQNTQGVPNMALFQEMTVDTMAVSAEERGGGVRMNFIPREGGNKFSALMIGSFSGEALTGDNFTPELQSRGLRTPNKLKNMKEFNPAVGGPIVRDKVWFFGSVLYNRVESFAADSFMNRNAFNTNAWSYDPDLSQPAFTDTLTKSGGFRLTWQATTKNKIAFGYEDTHTCQCPSVITATTAPESAVPQRYWPNGGWTLDWTAPITNRILLEGVLFHRWISTHRLHPFGLPDVGTSLDEIRAWNAQAMSTQLIGVQDQALDLTYRATTASVMRNQSRNWPMRASLAYITGAHSYKVGYYNNVGSKDNTVLNLDAPVSYRFNNGVPNQITMNATPFIAHANMDADLGIFGQDKWTMGRMTLSYGVRYDHFKSSFPQQEVGPGLLVPDRNFSIPAADGVSWHDVTPRGGLAFDLFGTGKTAVKVSAGKYMAGQALRGDPAAGTLVFGDDLNPMFRLVGTTTRSWNDNTFPVGDPRRGNYLPDCNLLNLATNGECGAASNSDFGSLRSGSTYDPEILSGWGKRVYSWQFSAGVQHELVPGVSVDLSFFRRLYGNFNVVDDRARSAADFDTFSITAPSDPGLPGGGGYTVSGLYNIKPAQFTTPANNYITFADTYGKRTEHWNGFDLTMNARPRSGVMLQGGLSSGKTTLDNCEIVAQLPEILLSAQILGEANANAWLPAAYCHQASPFLTQVKFLGSYTIPRIDVLVSGTIQSLPGPHILSNFTATNAIVSPSLGRSLSGNAANMTVNILEPGALYGDRRNQLDLRIGKVLKFGQTRSNLSFDLNNVLNANPVLTESFAYASWRRPQSILPARFVKVSFQVEF